MNIHHHKILIIGAGMAGLGAATKLLELGETDFKIIEAKNKSGGRIHTILVHGKPLDLGAQWLHGKDNALYKICIKHNLLSNTMSEEGLGLYVRSDGHIFENFLVKQVDFKIGQLLEKCQTFVNEVDCPKSVGDFLEEEFNKYLEECGDEKEVKEMKKELFDWHVRFQVIDNSCFSLKDLSAKGWGEYICIDDIAHYNLKDGYQSLVNVITEELPDDSIILNTEVVEIDMINYSRRILVKCKDHKTFSCDHLILTTSLGVLKKFGKINPVLPKTILNSISDMGFGAIAKIYLFFDVKWWGDVKAFQLIFAENYKFDKKEQWLKHLTGFDEVYGQPNALMGWVGGRGVLQVESMEESEIGEQCVNILRNFLRKYYIPSPAICIRTRWLSDPHIKGSYCHITPKCDSGHTGIRQLEQPVVVQGIPKLFLAGEAVHQSSYSTTHGAYESGQNQAQRLLDFLKK